MKNLALVLFFGVLSVGCNANRTGSTPAFPPDIGVHPCDEYLSGVETLLKNPNVPQTMRDRYKQSLEQNRTAWKQATATENGREQLESSCKTALHSAKPALDQYGQK